MITNLTISKIKAATRDLVAACGGLERAAAIASVSTSQLSRCQHNSHGDLIGIMPALALEADCGLHLVTNAMAQVHGRSLSDPDGAGSVHTDIPRRNADLFRSAAEAFAVAADALEDGAVTPSEAEMLDRAYGDMDRKLGAARSAAAAAKLKVVGGSR